MKAGSTPAEPAAPQERRDDLFGVLGVLGHELRNPLAPLANAVQVLRAGSPDAVAVDRVGRIMDRQIKVMTRLVDDLLDLPRLARGKMRLTSSSLDLSALVRDTVDDRRPAFEAAGIDISLELPSVPVHTTGDTPRLTQVIGNLLANAVKFTNRGGTVRVRLAVDLERRVAGLSVRDDGIGIDPSLLPKVFDPFIQADRSIERSRGGLGLGLALVKGLVELHGGAVWAESKGPGQGSEFGIELPLIQREPAEANAALPPRPTVSRRVLVIEDNRDSAESLKMYLELLGHKVAVAHTGHDGVNAAAAFLPDVVICDIGLPGMSGHAVCAELKKLSSLASAMFIALSGHAIDGDPPADGFDLYLLKPMDSAQLAGVIAGGPTRVPPAA